jgi:hypothetical protein
MTCWIWCRRGGICEHPLTVRVWRTTEDGGTIAARGRSQPFCLARHVVVRCPSPGTRPVRQTLAARRPAGGRQAS